MKMRRLALIVLLAAIALAGGRYVWKSRLEKRAQAAREAAYERQRLSYAEALSLGLNRKVVEDYLRSKNVSFQQLCCIDEKGYSDLVKIGEERKPLFCSGHDVFIALQFSPFEEGQRFSPPDDSDTLKRVTVFHSFEGCL